ncbi:MAG: hypothetical protein K0U84_19955 [Actinomycetia bacterium]|nr:hypothetical protein [Actinomycetes bacterium]
MFYSVTLAAMLAPVVAIAILVYLWSRRCGTTPWPLVTTMVATQIVIAALAFLDSPQTALMWWMNLCPRTECNVKSVSS